MHSRLRCLPPRLSSTGRGGVIRLDNRSQPGKSSWPPVTAEATHKLSGLLGPGGPMTALTQ